MLVKVPIVVWFSLLVAPLASGQGNVQVRSWAAARQFSDLSKAARDPPAATSKATSPPPGQTSSWEVAGQQHQETSKPLHIPQDTAASHESVSANCSTGTQAVEPPASILHALHSLAVVSHVACFLLGVIITLAVQYCTKQYRQYNVCHGTASLPNKAQQQPPPPPSSSKQQLLGLTGTVDQTDITDITKATDQSLPERSACSAPPAGPSAKEANRAASGQLHPQGALVAGPSVHGQHDSAQPHAQDVAAVAAVAAVVLCEADSSWECATDMDKAAAAPVVCEADSSGDMAAAAAAATCSRSVSMPLGPGSGAVRTFEPEACRGGLGQGGCLAAVASCSTSQPNRQWVRGQQQRHRQQQQGPGKEPGDERDAESASSHMSLSTARQHPPSRHSQPHRTDGSALSEHRSRGAASEASSVEGFEPTAASDCTQQQQQQGPPQAPQPVAERPCGPGRSLSQVVEAGGQELQVAGPPLRARPLSFKLNMDVQISPEVLREVVAQVARPVSDLAGCLASVGSGLTQLNENVGAAIAALGSLLSTVRMNKQQILCTRSIQLGFLLMTLSLLACSVLCGRLATLSEQCPPPWNPGPEPPVQQGASKGGWLGTWRWLPWSAVRVLAPTRSMSVLGQAACYLHQASLHARGLCVMWFIVLPATWKLMARDVHHSWQLDVAVLGPLGCGLGAYMVQWLGGNWMWWAGTWGVWLWLACCMYHWAMGTSRQLMSALMLALVLPGLAGVLPFQSCLGKLCWSHVQGMSPYEV